MTEPVEEQCETTKPVENYRMAPLVDLTNTSIHALMSGEDEALAQSLRRLLEDIDHPDGVISAFANIPHNPA